MRKRRKRRPNWPYRLTWLGIISAIALFLTFQTLVAAATYANRSYGTDWALAIVSSLLDATVGVWFVAVGASIGSFLNVVAYRLPLGRQIGGHSGCPYCGTPIDSTDNVPLLGWVKLRGRCRTCRLPISIQYPLVELTVAMMFFSVFITEFLTNGNNLPDQQGRFNPGGLMRMNISSQLVLRIIVYLPILSGLVGAALIAIKQKTVPLKLYGYALLPYAIGICVRPDLVIVRWREAAPEGDIAMRVDAVVTMVCGLAAGVVLARVLAPLLFGGFDRTLIAGDRATNCARQSIGAIASCGAVLGWQAIVPFAWVLVGCAILCVSIFRRYRATLCLLDVTAWAWIGILVFRGNWAWWNSIQILPLSMIDAFRHLAGAVLLVPFVFLFKHLANPETVSSRPATDKEPTLRGSDEELFEEDALSGEPLESP